MKSTTTRQGLLAFVQDVIIWNTTGGFGLQLYRGLLVLGMAVGIFAYSFQARFGLSVTGMGDGSLPRFVTSTTKLNPIKKAAAAIMT